MTTDPIFEHLGYFKEYYINNRYFGQTNEAKEDRECIGYLGRKDEIFDIDVILLNGKKIPKGVKCMTVLYPMQGKMKK